MFTSQKCSQMTKPKPNTKKSPIVRMGSKKYKEEVSEGELDVKEGVRSKRASVVFKKNSTKLDKSFSSQSSASDRDAKLDNIKNAELIEINPYSNFILKPKTYEFDIDNYNNKCDINIDNNLTNHTKKEEKFEKQKSKKDSSKRATEQLTINQNYINLLPKVDESTLVKCNSQTKLDFITSVDPKESLIKKHKMDLNIKQLTNTEDIVDFYEFLHECLNKIKLIEPASNEEIHKNKVDYILDKTKCNIQPFIF